MKNAQIKETDFIWMQAWFNLVT